MRDDAVERLLARFMSADQAAGIVGDLIEERQRRGRAWFWLNVARITFGLWRSAVAGRWIRDVRHAVRALARAPGFTLTVVVSLALATGANTAIFAVVNAVLLAPLPFRHADRLVHIAGTAPGTDQPATMGVPDELYFEYRGVPTLEDVALYAVESSTSRAEGHADELFASEVTPSFFSTLGAQTQLGRLPTPEDDDTVVVLSDWLWRSWFGSRDDVIGRSYFFGGGFRTVIGVMKPDFRFPNERIAYWTPMEIREAQVAPGGFAPRAIARMSPETDTATLTQSFEPLPRLVQRRLGGSAEYAAIMEHYRPVVTSIREHLSGGIATPLWILLGAVGVVFLVACANVAGLFMVRAENRCRDLVVRRALGAGRADLVRSQMSEALILAGVSGAIGALIARAGVPLLVRAAPDALGIGATSAPIPGLTTAGVGLPALMFTAGISVLAACAIGLIPAFRFTGSRLVNLPQAGRGVVGRTTRASDALVVLQTASAVVLLVGSVLLVRSFWQLSRVDTGYNTNDVFTFQVAFTPAEMKDRGTMSRLHYAFMDRLESLPGVESVGFVTTLPLDEGAASVHITTPRIAAAGGEAPLLRYTGTGGAYFQTMGIELLRGRLFDRVEEERGLPSVIISDAAARLLFAGEDPIGKQLRPAAASKTWFTVVGVVEDVLIDDLRRQSPQPTVYLPAASGSPAYVLKSLRAGQLEPDVRAVMREVLPQSPMFRVFTMKRLAARAMASLSFTMGMVSVAAAVALVLGAVGLYGVISYRVTRRAQEIGLRMALGAESNMVRWMFVRQGALLGVCGVAAGALAAAGLTTYLQALLFDVDRLDVMAFTLTGAVMLGVSLVASYLPALRASRLDPVIALRAE